MFNGYISTCRFYIVAFEGHFLCFGKLDSVNEHFVELIPLGYHGWSRRKQLGIWWNMQQCSRNSQQKHNVEKPAAMFKALVNSSGAKPVRCESSTSGGRIGSFGGTFTGVPFGEGGFSPQKSCFRLGESDGDRKADPSLSIYCCLCAYIRQYLWFQS